MSKYITD